MRRLHIIKADKIFPPLLDSLMSRLVDKKVTNPKSDSIVLNLYSATSEFFGLPEEGEVVIDDGLINAFSKTFGSQVGHELIFEGGCFYEKVSRSVVKPETLSRVLNEHISDFMANSDKTLKKGINRVRKH